MVAAPASSEAQLPSRVLEIRPEESKLVCVGAEGREFALSRLVGSNVRIGDEVLVPASTGTATADTEVHIRKPSLRRADVYQVKAGYAALPKLDKRDEPFVRVQVAEGQLGINVIHIPCHVIRDYFFAANRRASWPSQPTFYYVLRLPQDVTYKELRLAYRLRRMLPNPMDSRFRVRPESWQSEPRPRRCRMTNGAERPGRAAARPGCAPVQLARGHKPGRCLRGRPLSAVGVVLECLRAVSYTHLDVYKRQVPEDRIIFEVIEFAERHRDGTAPALRHEGQNSVRKENTTLRRSFSLYQQRSETGVGKWNRNRRIFYQGVIYLSLIHI